jgi:hypothetical protein
MDINEIIKKITSGDIPTGTLGGVGIIALLLAVRTARGFVKFIFVLVGLALLAGAVWWHLNHRR